MMKSPSEQQKLLRGLRDFAAKRPDRDQRLALASLAARVRGDILRMTTEAGSGHVGGALSSADILVVLESCARRNPVNPDDPRRDRVVVSHGHVSAALYASLGRAGYFEPEDAVAGFRRVGSAFEGHPNALLPGVDWGSGALGQGLSVGCGMALAARLSRQSYRVYVVMGDGEQQKGQVAEARSFAGHWRLANLTAVIDWNRLQATGAVAEIMPQDIAALYATAGWTVQVVNGHDHDALYRALRATRDATRPTVVLAETVMGKGVASIEGDYRYHGSPLKAADLAKALSAIAPAIQGRNVRPSTRPRPKVPAPPAPIETRVNPGTRRAYSPGSAVELRSAWANAIEDLLHCNRRMPIAVLDCDLGPSVKTDGVRKSHPANFIQCGIQEQHAASMAGGLSRSQVVAFWADFGVFALDEVFGQLRMIDMNRTSVKIVATHCGLDVGADGKTHQCIDYIGLAANLTSFRLIVPADANQMDAAIRHVATTPGNFVVACGRSPLPVLSRTDGSPYFGKDYTFGYGRADWLARGRRGVIVTCGTMVHRALEVRRQLGLRGLSVGVLNVTSPLALDPRDLRRAAATGYLLVYEDHLRESGLGVRIAAACSEQKLPCRVRRLGIVRHGGSGPPEELYRQAGLACDDCVAVATRDLRAERGTGRSVRSQCLTQT